MFLLWVKIVLFFILMYFYKKSIEEISCYFSIFTKINIKSLLLCILFFFLLFILFYVSFWIDFNLLYLYVFFFKMVFLINTLFFAFFWWVALFQLRFGNRFSWLKTLSFFIFKTTGLSVNLIPKAFDSLFKRYSPSKELFVPSILLGLWIGLRSVYSIFNVLIFLGFNLEIFSSYMKVFPLIAKVYKPFILILFLVFFVIFFHRKKIITDHIIYNYLYLVSFFWLIGFSLVFVYNIIYIYIFAPFYFDSAALLSLNGKEEFFYVYRHIQLYLNV